jgi:hypothetical protein
MSTPVYEFTPGDDFIIPMNITDPNNNNAPVDISTWVIESAVKYSREVLSTVNVTIVSGPLGQFTLTVPRAETALWPERRDLYWDIQITRPIQGRKSTETIIIRTGRNVTP